MGWRDKFNKCRRVVIKVGTSTLTYSNGQLNLQRIEQLVREMADLHNRDMEVLLVTSGAIGVGANRMGYKKVPKTMPEKQALAAVGQGALLHLYEKFFGEYGKTVAQVLLTRDDLDDRMRYLNATNALLAILAMDVIPIINENDTVVVDEIKFGDNDTLSALVAGIVNADLLLILSDVDGLYDCDPRTNKEAVLQHQVSEITRDMEDKSTSRGSSFSSGGMFTKLKAAQVCMAAGVPMVIANSDEDNVIRRVVGGEELGTLFIPREEKMHAREKWIAFGTVCQGKLLVDAGARQALLNRGKSLLPSGVTGVEGEFDRGTVVAVIEPDGREIARGLVNYAAREIALIAGKRSSEIEAILGEKDYDEVIHRNNLWVRG
ncbi:glutamate 5-kinase [Syntrophomonas wolfei]|uniref:Glutamate 5-kinase n=1 Tax=Syntrophomonas wolfei subsp. wolfei (strain DSM 2245B / Goettingen) TaxID=335541 RepID=Q0AWJ5_SYNWW|nr:glutamate 5-kinase [Syntrophomonas wolfei]ABI68909.1 glutamate 5-kinase [Syntrophomonas wolfei subsp. wolfei str. Goettingen G311]